MFDSLREPGVGEEGGALARYSHESKTRDRWERGERTGCLVRFWLKKKRFALEIFEPIQCVSNGGQFMPVMVRSCGVWTRHPGNFLHFCRCPSSPLEHSLSLKLRRIHWCFWGLLVYSLAHETRVETEVGSAVDLVPTRLRGCHNRRRLV